MPVVTVDEAVVDLVADDQEVVTIGDLRHGGQRVGRERGPGWVARVAQQQGSGAGRDGSRSHRFCDGSGCAGGVISRLVSVLAGGDVAGRGWAVDGERVGFQWGKCAEQCAGSVQYVVVAGSNLFGERLCSSKKRGRLPQPRES